MPKLWVKDAGTWKAVQKGLITVNNIGRQFYPDTIPTEVYSVPGSYTYTVPAGVSSINAVIVGGGGGGSSANSGCNYG